jgi:hypothetical protein
MVAVAAVGASLVIASCSAGDHAKTGSSSSAAASTSSSATDSPDPAAVASLPVDERGMDPHNCEDPAFKNVYPHFCNGAPAPEGAGAPLEGSVTLPGGTSIDYSDGLRAEIVSVTSKPNDPNVTGYAASSHPDFDTLVSVVFRLTNAGSSVLQLQEVGAHLQLLYGQDRYDATCWATDGGEQDLPQRLVPGSSATFDQDCTMPSSGQSVLALTFTPADVPISYTFTDVQTLLH